MQSYSVWFTLALATLVDWSVDSTTTITPTTTIALTTTAADSTTASESATTTIAGSATTTDASATTTDASATTTDASATTTGGSATTTIEGSTTSSIRGGSTTISPSITPTISPVNVTNSTIGGFLGNISGIIGGDKIVTDPNLIPQPFDSRFDNFVPNAMISPNSSADIILVLNKAFEAGVTVAVRGASGLSVIGQSTVGSEGILLNLANMTSFQIVNTTNSTNTTNVTSPVVNASIWTNVTVGAGVRMLDLYTQLANQSQPLGFNGGIFPSIGISGLLSGGGYGFSSAKYGMSSDRVVAAKVVVWNTTTKVFEEIDAPDDLLFALKGGMGGNYGVVTEWTIQAFQVSNVVVFNFTTDAVSDANITTLVTGFGGWLRNPVLSNSTTNTTTGNTTTNSSTGNSTIQSDLTNATWGLFDILTGSKIRLLGQCICADTACADCTQGITYLRDSVLGGCDGDDALLNDCFMEVEDFGKAQWTWAGCTDFADGENDVFPNDGLNETKLEDVDKALLECYEANPPVSIKFKSLYFNRTAAVSTILSSATLAANAEICNTTEVICSQEFSLVAGLMTEQLNDTSFEHRTPGWLLALSIQWTNKSVEDLSDSETLNGSAAFLNWTNVTYTTLLPLSSQEGYQNYLDNDLDISTWSAQYFPGNGTFDKLIAARNTYNKVSTIIVPQAANMTIPLVNPNGSSNGTVTTISPTESTTVAPSDDSTTIGGSTTESASATTTIAGATTVSGGSDTTTELESTTVAGSETTTIAGGSTSTTVAPLTT